MVDNQIKKSQCVGHVITFLIFTCKDCKFWFYHFISGLVYRKSKKLIISQKDAPDKELGRISCKKCGSGNVRIFKDL